MVQAVGVTDFLEFTRTDDDLHVLLKFGTLSGGEHVIAIPPDILLGLIPVILSTQHQAEPASASGRILRRSLDIRHVEALRAVAGGDVVLTLDPVTGGNISFRLNNALARQLRDGLTTLLE